MSSGRKCKNCGSSDIEVDSARGDAVCTNCGTVLEDNIIVAEVEFQENTRGGPSAIGQFVSAESKGGATGFGASFHVGMGVESREVTIRKAKEGITRLSQQLRLNQYCIDMACNFFKMALSRQLTKGRPGAHIHAACVYITCRTEGTAHLLIDISDVLQIDCYQLGRTYLRLSQALCITIPSIDPCLYILRFASKLDFGEKTHEVSTTALRLVQRMKRDSLHSGRRPSGLCGAALLIAARLHEFNRVPTDVVRIVKVHESTLRKRLMEFGDTPSSALTLDEFLTVDLEEEQDPPAFKAARRRDKDRLQRLLDEEGGESVMSELQKEIERQLDSDGKKKKTPSKKSSSGLNLEEIEADKFACQSTMESIKESLIDDSDGEDISIPQELGPDLASMGLCLDPDNPPTPGVPESPVVQQTIPEIFTAENMPLDDVDDDEIESIILTPFEASTKSLLWHRLNKDYLNEQRLKEEIRAKEREEGKPEKKKRKAGGKKKGTIGPSASAGEAIEKMLQEKKISSKINYDILKTLNRAGMKVEETVPEQKPDITIPVIVESPSRKRKPAESPGSRPIVLSSPVKMAALNKRSRMSKSAGPVGLPVVQSPQTPAPVEDQTKPTDKADYDTESEYYEEDAELPEASAAPEMESLSQMLHSQDDEQEYYGFDDYQ